MKKKAYEKEIAALRRERDGLHELLKLAEEAQFKLIRSNQELVAKLLQKPDFQCKHIVPENKPGVAHDTMC